MSNAPSSSNPARSTAAPEPTEDTPGQQRPRDVASLARAAASAVGTIASRAVGLGALGLGLGAVAFFVERGTGLLAHPWEPWRYAVYALLLAYMGLGAFGFGTAGLWRGIGRVAMDLVREHQLCQRIIERVFERAALLADGARTPELLRKPLPIQAVRELLSRAIAAYATSDDDEAGLRGFSRTILRRLKLRVCRQVETKLIELIGEETRDRHAVELTLSRLRELADAELEGRVMEALEGARNKQVLLWGALFALGVALPPVVLRLMGQG